MLFVTQLRILPGQFEEATRLFKHPKLPNNVMLHEFLGLLGKPDAVVIFEAPDASTAADFMVQFSRVPNATRYLAPPTEEFNRTSGVNMNTKEVTTNSETTQSKSRRSQITACK